MINKIKFKLNLIKNAMYITRAYDILYRQQVYMIKAKLERENGNDHIELWRGYRRECACATLAKNRLSAPFEWGAELLWYTLLSGVVLYIYIYIYIPHPIYTYTHTSAGFSYRSSSSSSSNSQPTLRSLLSDEHNIQTRGRKRVQPTRRRALRSVTKTQLYILITAYSTSSIYLSLPAVIICSSFAPFFY